MMTRQQRKGGIAMEYKMTVERLAELGIVFSQKETAVKFAEMMQAKFEIGVGKEISDGLTKEKIDELEKLLEDDGAVSEWLEINKPDYSDIIDKCLIDLQYELIKNRTRIKGVLDIPEYDIREVEIDDLDLSLRCFNCLRRASCNTIEDTFRKSDLNKIRNLSKKCVTEYMQAVICFMEERVRSISFQLDTTIKQVF